MNDLLRSFSPRKYAAELVGTALLALVVGVIGVGSDLYASSYQALYVPLAIGLLITVLVYVFGPASGAHFNPAVTVALMSIGKIKKRDAAFYLLCQFVGAYLGFWVAYVLIGSRGNPSFSLDGPAFLGEVLGTFLLLLAIASVVLGKISASLSGVVIGLALTIGISISLITSGGVLNPAIALSLGAMHFSYLAAPFIGALLGALFISWLYAKPSDVK